MARNQETSRRDVEKKMPTAESDVIAEPATFEDTVSRPLRAVLYLRVSTKSQVNTDYDPEGISLPAQRQSCHRRAEQLDNVTVVDEYVEPGESGRGTLKRPQFQAMLERIRTQHDVDLVIVYKLSRLHRNRVDDALTMMELRKQGVNLISATESIDETPVGQLMHGILASFNEYRSAEDGADIRHKMAQKAKNGGTLGRAPLGYSNVRDRVDGREIRTVDLDTERAPLIRLAFELYATGKYTLTELAEELTDRGLTTRPGRYPAREVSTSKLGKMLEDRYYLGFVTFQGEEYPGRHEPLVDYDTWERVQEVKTARIKAGERQRKHHHYLKGTIWCGACHEAGRENRLIQSVVRGNGGTYRYFVCRGQQKGQCDIGYLHEADVEQAVADWYFTIEYGPDLTNSLRKSIHDTLADAQQATRTHRAQLDQQMNRLELAEANLIDLAADGTLPSPKIRERLHDIQVQRARIQDSLSEIHVDLGKAAELLEAAIDFLSDPGDLYARSANKDRRLINQAVFAKLYVYDDAISADEPSDAFYGLISLQRPVSDVSTTPEAAVREAHEPTAHRRHSPQREAALLRRALQEDHGSSKAAMVELRGIEPLTSSMPWKRSAN